MGGNLVYNRASVTIRADFSKTGIGLFDYSLRESKTEKLAKDFLYFNLISLPNDPLFLIHLPVYPSAYFSKRAKSTIVYSSVTVLEKKNLRRKYKWLY